MLRMGAFAALIVIDFGAAAHNLENTALQIAWRCYAFWARSRGNSTRDFTSSSSSALAT